MNAPSPVVQHLASQPCRLCGGAEFSHFHSVPVMQGEARFQYFEMLVCRTCRKTDVFADLANLERLNPHAVLRAQGHPPHR
jgi:hypothetical protein